MKKVLNVTGMSCSHCVKTIKESVSSLKGVSDTEVSLKDGEVTTEFDENVVSLDEIKEAIEDAGYDIV